MSYKKQKCEDQTANKKARRSTEALKCERSRTVMKSVEVGVHGLLITILSGLLGIKERKLTQILKHLP